MPTITGTANADTLRGTIGADSISAAGGDDVITGAGGIDTIDAGTGNDRILWTVGDGSDVVEGGAGVDEQFLTGTAGADNFTLSAAGGHVLASDGAETLNIHGVEEISLQTLAGADTIQVGDLSTTEVRTLVIDVGAADIGNTVGLTGAATDDLINVQVSSLVALRVLDSANGVVTTTVVSSIGAGDQLSVNGGAGDDTISVTSPSGVLNSAGFVLAGGAGNDTLAGGAENDTFVWSSGDGSDKIDGGAGFNTAVVNGSQSADNISVSQNGSAATAVVNGSQALSLTNIQTLNVSGGSGDDVLFDAGNATLSGGIGNDTLTEVGSDTITGFGGSLFGGDGNDLVTVSGFAQTIDGGAGDDAIHVTGVADPNMTATISGGAGNDSIDYRMAPSQHGLAFIDGGTDSDVVTITPLHNGNASSDPAMNETLTATGAGAELEVATAGSPGVMDFELKNSEKLAISGGRGADHFSVGDLAGTGVNLVTIDLGARRSSGQLDSDFKSDEVDLRGHAGANHLVLTGDASALTVSGLSATVVITNLNPDPFFPEDNIRDSLVVTTGSGDDVIDLSNAHVDAFLTIDAGAGDDTITAGSGAGIFQFTFGHDRINNFNVGHDTIHLTHLFDSDGVPDLSLADMEADGHIFQDGADVLITDGTSHFLTLANVDLGSLSDSNFIFGI